jgi:hypothetical protein
VYGDAKSGLVQMPGGHETVAAIIPGAGYHGGLAAWRMPGDDGSGDCGAGILHQCLTWDAGLDGTAIRLAHLRIGEKFQHRSRDNNFAAATSRMLLKIGHA